MDVLAELIRMAAAAGRLWLRRFPTIAAWVALGWAGRELSLLASVAFGGNLVPSLMMVVLGMLIWVVCLVMMLHSLSSDLTCVDRLDASDDDFPAARKSRREVLLEAVIPFLAVYAVWGLTEEQVRRAFSANLIYHGTETDNFSITFAAWPLYLGIAIGAWAAQALLAWWLRRRNGPVRRQGPAAAISLTLLRGISLITAFVGLDTAWTHIQDWLYTRAVRNWAVDAWESFLGWIPQWELPWSLTLPETLRAGARALWEYIVPGLIDAALLPVVWLALTAMVFGWHEFAQRGARLRLPNFIDLRMRRINPSSPLGALSRGAGSLVGDFIPAAQALRLLLRSGVGFLAAYLLLGALARALGTWVSDGLLWIIGPRSFADTLVHLSAVEFAGELVAWTVAGCVYITAFDRAMNRAIRTAPPLRHDRSESEAPPERPLPVAPAGSTPQ